MSPISPNQLDAKFLNDLIQVVWPTLGITLVSEHTDRLCQRRFGDGVIVDTLQGRRHIDWKANQTEYASFPVELLQDWQSFDIGWFYTLQCDDIWYGHYVSNALKTVDIIDFRALKQLPHDSVAGLRPKMSDKGQGHTVFVPLQLSFLRRQGVSKCVFDLQAVTAELF
jgi:hypothetical protein